MLHKKAGLLISFLFGYLAAHSQVISGRVIADSTNRPVTATITTALHQTSSNANGEFRIATSGAGDTIRVFAIGFKTYLLPVNKWKQADTVIKLKPASKMLKDVVIKANRDHQKDSIRNREDFKQVFNFKPPKVTDALRMPTAGVPFAFVSIDVLTLIKALNKKHDPTYKLQQVMLKDERADYINTRYNRSFITRHTNLKGDSLEKFFDKYYPTADWVSRTSDYDIILYVKAKAAEFRAGN